MTRLDIHAAIDELESVFGPFVERDCIPESRIQAAEARLGTSVPEELRVLYRRSGAHPLHRACDKLLPPESLALDGRYLVFYEQAQGAMRWATPTGGTRPNKPQVYVGYDDGCFEPESDSIAEFALLIGASQGVEGGARHYAFTDTPPKLDGDPRVTCRHGEVFLRAGAILLHRPQEPYLGLASNDRAAFDRVAAMLGIADDAWTFHSGVR